MKYLSAAFRLAADCRKAEFFISTSDDSDKLEAGFRDRIQFYNHDRVKLELQGISPVQYRTQFDVRRNF
ncbi:IS3 family transposase [Paraburkholderia sp. GAS333]|uniref:IS3 family transposase n=1 Tax=Paraburkholderia sp. GAS333 TaxID=3156279 RepID=UPI003D20A488